MTDDILDRIRKYEWAFRTPNAGEDWQWPAQCPLDAADEIERLREALAEAIHRHRAQPADCCKRTLDGRTRSLIQALHVVASYRPRYRGSELEREAIAATKEPSHD